ncbi:hypothetical protein, partial [Klebsiella pneumoniae]|uniref:hypothetical protein n=1 Tax=Klebsiella pneumoniae TaxID=573 RepID=UPI0025569B29
FIILRLSPLIKACINLLSVDQCTIDVGDVRSWHTADVKFCNSIRTIQHRVASECRVCGMTAPDDVHVTVQPNGAEGPAQPVVGL